MDVKVTADTDFRYIVISGYSQQIDPLWII